MREGTTMMTKRFRAAAAATSFTLLGLLAGSRPIEAQDPTPTKVADPAVKKKHDAARRVPAYFGQIGLTTEQRANIYNIQGKRLEKIEALEQQIAAEKAEMLAQCEASLTETQKKLLDNLRRAAAEPAATKTVDASKPGKFYVSDGGVNRSDRPPHGRPTGRASRPNGGSGRARGSESGLPPAPWIPRKPTGLLYSLP